MDSATRSICLVMASFFIMTGLKADTFPPSTDWRQFVPGPQNIARGYNSRQIPSFAQSHSYNDQIQQIPKLVQQQQYIESNSEIIQENLDKVSSKLWTFASSFRKESPNYNPLYSLISGNSGSYLMDPQKILLSGVRAVEVVGAEESTCGNDTMLLFSSLFENQTWAYKFFDAFGKPGPGLTAFRLNFVGDYNLCRSSTSSPINGSRIYKGNYCTVAGSLGGADVLGMLTPRLGVCLPDTCTEQEITVFVSQVVQELGLNNTLKAESTECHIDNREITTATVVAIVFLVIIGLLMLLGTLYDILVIQWPKWTSSSTEKKGFLSNGYHGRSPDPDHEVTGEETDGLGESTSLLGKIKIQQPSKTGVCPKVLLAFSVYTNGSKVLNTNQPPGSLGAIHGIRFLSMSWVVLGHVLVFGLGQVENLMTAFPNWLNTWTFDVITNAFSSVDTFFALSGLLTSYLTLNEMKKRGWKINWPLFYFHRFWRLTPPYMLTIVFVLGLQQYMGSGALWSSVQPTDKVNCEKNWWTNLLYINNIVEADGMCFGHSWYLANDMQFFILSPLLLIPFYFKLYLGLAVSSVFLLATWITTGVLSAQNAWPTTLLGGGGGAGGIASPNLQVWFQDYYIKPWCRIGPYIVGIVFGYILSSTNGKIRMSRVVVCVGWIVSIATGLAVVYGLRGDIGSKDISSVGVAALYNTLSRTAWGACVCWVVLACASGHGGFVNTILSWSPFVMLGRLTYMSYLIHPTIVSIYFQNSEQLFYLTDTNIAVLFCGIILVTNMCAFALMLAFESPWIGLEKVLLRKKQGD